MKKQFLSKKQFSQTKIFFMAVSLAGSLCACGDTERSIPDSGSVVSEPNTEISGEEEIAGKMDPQGGFDANASGLRFLCEDDGEARCSNEGAITI